MVAPGQVVVLNGTSSAGKTSLAKAFQQIRADAADCWLVVGLDDFLAKLPGRWVEVDAWVGSLAEDGVRLERDGEVANFHVGALAKRLMVAYRRTIREIALSGINVIVDEVSLEADEWDDWCAALSRLPVVWVAVRCDIDVAVQREAARGDRALGLVRGQADRVHQCPDYAFELDTTELPVEELARQLDEFVRTYWP